MLFGKQCVRSLNIAHYVFVPSRVWSNNLQNHIVGISSLNHESSPIPLSTSQNSRKLKNYKKTLRTVSKWRLIIWLYTRLTVTAIRPTGDDIWWSMWPLVSDSDRSVSRPHQVNFSWCSSTAWLYGAHRLHSVMVLIDCIALWCSSTAWLYGAHRLRTSNYHGVLRLNSFNNYISVLSCWSVPGLKTQGVAQADSGAAHVEGAVGGMAELRLGDIADSTASLPNVHKKADTILAQATVSGTAAQLVRHAKCKYNLYYKL